MSNPVEKIAKLEERVETLIDKIEGHMKKEEEDRKVLDNRLSKIEEVQLKNAGFIAGVVTVVSGLWAIGTAIWLYWKG